jgi:hypothetical protein
MDAVGNWLFSVESANSLAGALGGADADPRDVIRYDATAGTYSYFFCGSAVGIPSGVNVDAVYSTAATPKTSSSASTSHVTLAPFTLRPADIDPLRRTEPACGTGPSSRKPTRIYDASCSRPREFPRRVNMPRSARRQVRFGLSPLTSLPTWGHPRIRHVPPRTDRVLERSSVRAL